MGHFVTLIQNLLSLVRQPVWRCMLKRLSSNHIFVFTVIMARSFSWFPFVINRKTKHLQSEGFSTNLFFFSRSLTHLTYLAVLLTSSRVTEITWPNTWRSTKMCKPCGTLAPRRGANLWSGPPQWTLNAPLWTTVRVETGLTTRRDMGKSFCFIQLSARTFGFQWETSLQINAESTN